MAVRMADALKNPILDAYETAYGTAPVLRIYDGNVNASFGVAPTGALRATMTLPSDWMASSSGGSKAKAGTWQVNASTTGDIGCWTLSTSGGTIYEDGTAGLSGSGADLIVDSTSAVSGQAVTITAWTLGVS